MEDTREGRDDVREPGRRRRTGSRLLLAAALAGGAFAAIFAAARISDLLCDIAGVTSTMVRLAVKVAAIAAALPAGFYLVERWFLARSARNPRRP